jgi:hypothetical protein
MVQHHNVVQISNRSIAYVVQDTYKQAWNVNDASQGQLATLVGFAVAHDAQIRAPTIGKACIA